MQKLYRMLFEDGADTGGGGGGPPADPPPAKAIAPAAPPSNDADIDPDTRLYVPDGKGGETVKTIQQLIDDAQKVNTVDPDLIKQAELLKGVKAGDHNAANELWQSFAPAAPEPVKTPEQEELSALREKVAALEAGLNQQGATVQQVEDARMLTGIKSIVEQRAGDLPWTAKHPQGSNRVLEKFKELKAQASALPDVNVADGNMQIKLLAMAMKQVENQMTVDARAFGVEAPAKPAETNGNPPAPTARDDQDGRHEGSLPPGAVGFINGKPVDQWGRIVYTQGQPVDPTVVDTPVDPIKAGGTPPDGTESLKGPFDGGALRRFLKQKSQGQQT